MSCQFSCSAKSQSYECNVPQTGPCSEIPGGQSNGKEPFKSSHSLRAAKQSLVLKSDNRLNILVILTLIILSIVLVIIRNRK